MASSETANTRQVPVMMCRYFSAVLAAALLLVVATGIPPAVAQGAGNWSTDLDLKPPPGSAATP
ncbi:MAG: hypothetical protein KDE45_24630, partial [Caldilineaceae bacterium]|nr:hypothetical protein [Caldilineaceae bacterium]